jgi:hypothetical protein
VETVGGEGIIHFCSHAIEAGKDPAVFQSLRVEAGDANRFGRDFAGKSARATFQAVYIHEHESGGVPDLVGEGAIAVGAALAEGDVGSGRGHGRQSEASCVGTKALDDFEGVDNVALGLRHFLAVRIPH